MATYTKLTQDEKAAVIDSQVRSLEFQMYAAEVEITAENAKSEPNAERITALNGIISEKQAQITAITA